LKKTAQAYLKGDLDRSKAIKYLKSYLKAKPKDKEAWLMLSDAYLYNLDITNSKIAFEKYSKTGIKKKKAAISQLLKISNIEYLLENEKNVSISNLGEAINTSGNEHLPIIEPKYKYLFYQSNKAKSKGRIQLNGELNYDIYYAKYNGDYFKNSRPIKKLNSTKNENIMGVSSKGKFLYYSSQLQFTNSILPSQIMQSIKKGIIYKKKMHFEAFHHLENLNIHSFFFNEEKSQYFISAKKGKKGGFNIYLVNKLPNEKWSDPILLPFCSKNENEINPFYHTETNTLYLSSDRLGGLGGYDIYNVIFDDQNQIWEEINNLGYPINSPYDEKNITLTNNGDNGFISSIRPGGFGKYDIYNITFLNEPVRRVIYLIDFLNPEDHKHYENLKLDIYNEKNLLIGKYAPNENNGVFTIILEKGNYKIIGESNDEIVFEKIIKVSEFDVQNEIKTINFSD